MRVYLAARYSRLAELNEYKKELVALGHEVTSNWLTKSGREFETLTEDEKRATAIEDVDDIVSADAVIVFAEEPDAEKSHGGKHVELGLAMGQEKRVAVIGPIENVFYTHPHLERYGSWEELMAEVKAE